VDVTNATAGRFQSIRWVAQTGSTNADLKQETLVNASQPLVLFTDEQTAGRGRLDRSGTMRSGGGIMVSFFVPWLDLETAHAINTALSVAVIDAIAEVSPIVPTLKWPNDVVIDDDMTSTRKLAGILAEVVSSQGNIRGVIAGLGLNISWPTNADIAGAPDELGRAVALDDVAGAPVDRSELAAHIVRLFDSELQRLDGDGLSALHGRYESRCSTIGRRVRIEQPGRTLEGTATGLDPTGALTLSVDGADQNVAVGDVIHLRDIP